MKRPLIAALLAAAGGFAAWQGLSAYQEIDPPAPQPESAAPVDAPAADNATAAVAAPRPRPAPPVAPVRPISRNETPMTERVAVLGVLNKRNGLSRDITLKPGQAIRLNDLIVRLRACETTADWEPEQLTGAFVQVDVRGRDGTWGRVFSGWLYKESPSLNVVEHPIYDVWPKSCAMTHPDIGPETVSLGGGGDTSRSSAPKSTPAAATAATLTPGPTPPAIRAESSNAR